TAIMTEIPGIVHIDDTKKNRHVMVTGVDENGAPTEADYSVPFGMRVKVEEGQEVTLGEMLTEGDAYPQDILAIRGKEAVQDYLIQEVQRVYRLQGVDINDKHVEVIVRQMMRKAKITDGGTTTLLAGATVDKSTVFVQNADVRERTANGVENLKEAEYADVLLGITKASLATESFLSAASFQETTRVLTDAAIKGKTDYLLGLKENVIIGKLIPAGTGLFECKAREDRAQENSDNGEYVNSDEDFAE
ncbi:MAG: DNA-directed RNA polymerase subunit beta', partial [Oscillospiraceae bacterium]